MRYQRNVCQGAAVAGYLREVWQARSHALWLALLRIFTGFIFLHSGWGKLTDPGFLPGMARTLGYFASENPYPWMQRLLQEVAIPNAHFFGLLTGWGELLVGLSLFFGVLSPVGLLGALALNLTFYFAAGWTSPGTATANQMMAVAEVVMFLGCAGRVLSVEQLWRHRCPGLLPWWRAEEPAQA